MKKTVFLLLSALLLVCSLAACGDQAQEMNSSNHVSLVATADTVESTEMSEIGNSNELAEPSEAVSNGEVENSPEAQNVQQSADSTDGSNILIVYFSRYGNTEYPADVDATTSASIVADGTGRYGTTEYVANMIQQAVGGDVHRIETVIPYTEDFNELRDVNHDEMDQNVLPELKISNLDIASYDTVFIGYPVRAVPIRQSQRQAMQQSHRMALQ